jgi:hypothetical protein
MPSVFSAIRVPMKINRLCPNARGISVAYGSLVNRVAKLEIPANPARAVPFQLKNE